MTQQIVPRNNRLYRKEKKESLRANEESAAIYRFVK